jgi:hypothetical protein
VTAVTAAYLAEDLGMLQDDDIRAAVAMLVDLHDDEIPAEVAVEVRDMLNPNGERNAPANLYWPGHDRGDADFLMDGEPVYLFEGEDRT